MNDMFFMLNRMTVSTKNFKIFGFVVFVVSVLVMNSKNFWMFAKPATIAMSNQSASAHSIQDAGMPLGVELTFDAFADASPRTIYSAM